MILLQNTLLMNKLLLTE